MQRANPDRFAVRATLLAASMLAIFGGAMMAPTLPAIRAQFSDVNNIDFWVRFVLTLPPLLIAICAPIAGYLVDSTGRKIILVTATIVAGFAGVSGYFLQSFSSILLGRAILGLAVAGIMTSTTTLIADYYYGPERSRMMGLQAGVMGLFATAMLPLIGTLADSNWRIPFLVHVIAFAILPFILVFLYEPRPPERCVDKPTGQADPGTCVGQSIQEARPIRVDDAPLATPTRLIGFVYAVIILIEVVFYVVPVHLPFYLQGAIGATAAQTGLAISVMTLSFAISSFLFGRVAQRLDHIQVLMLGFALIGLGYAMITLSGGSALLYVGLSVSGFGIGQVIPNLYVWLADETPAPIRGRVMGGFTTALFLGQFLSPIISQPVVSAVSPETTFLVAGLVLVVLLPFVWVVRGRLRELAVQPI